MDAFLPRSLQDLGSWPEAAQRAVVSGENENGFDEAVGDLLGANVCSDDVRRRRRVLSRLMRRTTACMGGCRTLLMFRGERQGGQTGRRQAPEGRAARETEDEAEEAPQEEGHEAGEVIHTHI